MISNQKKPENPLALTRPSAVLLDWDNTLVDTWPTIHQALTETFEAMGHTPWTMQETKTRVHRSMRDAFPELFGDEWKKAGDIYMQNFRRIHLEKLTPLPSAEKLLALLRELEVFVAVVSNKTGINLRKEIEHIGWQPYFRKVVGATDALKDKPHPDPVHMALDNSGIQPGKDVWLVGDSVTDLECAHNTGCIPMFYGEEDITEKRFSHCLPMMHFRTHDELIAFIRSL